MSIETEEFWTGDFGNEYHKRNRVDWKWRIPFWKKLLEYYVPARSVFEFGCGPGWNLSAINAANRDVKTYGYEINEIAANQARFAGIEMVTYYPDEPAAPMFDLVFTCGVLIHIPPDDLKQVMQGLIDSSVGYVLAIEYEAKEETEVEYRGHKGKLWKRDYGKLYQELGLELVEKGFLLEFDNCTYWLMRKPL